MIYPLCFKSPKQFAEWKRLASQAREEATPCSDCTAKYRAQMTAIGRCNEEAVKAAFKHIPITKYKPRKVVPA